MALPANKIIQFRDRVTDASVYPIGRMEIVFDSSGYNLNTYITEYNVNAHDDGANSGNNYMSDRTYNLEQAVEKLPPEYKRPGIKLTFRDSSQGGAFKIYRTYDGVTFLPVDEDVVNPFIRGSGADSAILRNSGSASNGDWSVAEGKDTSALGIASHTEGRFTIAGGDESHAEGSGSHAHGNSSHAEGWDVFANEDYSHAEGDTTTAYNVASHSEGSGEFIQQTYVISGNNKSYTSSSAHNLSIGQIICYNNGSEEIYAKILTVGSTTTFTTDVNLSSSALSNARIDLVKGISYGEQSHSEGKKSTASGKQAHSEGNETVAAGDYSYAGGTKTFAIGENSHAEGAYTLASGRGSHAEGVEYNEIGTSAMADAAHAEGAGVVVKGQAAHGEGLLNVAGRTQEAAVAALADFPNLSGTIEQKVSKLIGFASHSEGSSTQALGTSSHAEGNSTQALVNSTHAEGDTTTASGEAAHSEGYNTTASGNQSHSEGYNTKATANQAHSEGKKTIASAENAHSEGNETKAVGNASHSEGYRTYAYGAMSHIEGTSSTLVSDANAASASVESIWEQNGHNFSLSRGQGSHVEGKNCLATGDWSHAEGAGNIAEGAQSHAEGFSTVASGQNSHAEGYCTLTKNLAEHAEGTYNDSCLGKTIHSVGIGNAGDERKNAFEITNDGSVYVCGLGNYNGNLRSDSSSLQQVIDKKRNSLCVDYNNTYYKVRYGKVLCIKIGNVASDASLDYSSRSIISKNLGNPNDMLNAFKTSLGDRYLKPFNDGDGGAIYGELLALLSGTTISIEYGIINDSHDVYDHRRVYVPSFIWCDADLSGIWRITYCSPAREPSTGSYVPIANEPSYLFISCGIDEYDQAYMGMDINYMM